MAAPLTSHPSLRRAITLMLDHLLGGHHNHVPLPVTPATIPTSLDDIHLIETTKPATPSSTTTAHGTLTHSESNTDVLHDILAKCSDLVDLPLASRSMPAILFETTVDHLIEMQFRVAAMASCAVYLDTRQSLIQDFIQKLDCDASAIDVAAAETTCHALSTVYKNEVLLLKRVLGRYEAVSRENLKRRLHERDAGVAETERDEMERHLAEATDRVHRDFPDKPITTDVVRVLQHELSYLIGHCRAVQAFYTAKLTKREELELDRRRRLVVLKNPHSELAHYEPTLRAELDDVQRQYSELHVRLEAALAKEASHQEDQLLHAMCCVRSDATFLTTPTLHSSHVHKELWAKFHRVERKVIAEVRLPRTLQHWVALAQLHAALPESTDGGDAIAAAVAKEAARLTAQHNERLREIQDAHRVEIETIAHARRQRNVEAVVRRWKATLEHATPMLELDDDDGVGPISSEDEVRHDHRAELFAVVQMTRMVARRRAKAARQKAVLQMEHLETLQATHDKNIATLRAELDVVQSLEHAKLMERVKKRRAIRTIKKDESKKDEEDEATEKEAVVEERQAELDKEITAAALTAQAAAIEALAAEAVTASLTTASDSGGNGGDLGMDNFGTLVKRLADTDVARVKCTMSQVHALEKVVLKVRERVKESTKPNKAKAKGSLPPKKRVFH
ncbi:Aste57867_13510 [Aphanomyces stellatus]|uniref:Aste57867_13510 protein n=1 Tax=Aphanomyces stellatus TaxID=120398 RepID=A0A485L0D6_9STRA|nr:hypothetical protein As57867_013460 [Aphanomyces stellatus]VFT90348.1 Aste57867_13510 [Aphanomyces stellatus]